MRAPTTVESFDATVTSGDLAKDETGRHGGGAGVGSRTEIAALAGSTRSASWAKALLRAAAKQLPADIELVIWNDLDQIPPFNEDRESEPVNPAVASLRDAIHRTGALLIVTPEYNGSFPGVLKNAIDWASRPYGDSVLQRTPIAVIGTSPLPSGGAAAASDLERVLTRIRAEVVQTELVVPLVHTRLEDDSFTDCALAAQINQVLIRLATRAKMQVDSEVAR